MKTKILIAIGAFLFALNVQATCTVTTDCGSWTFEDATSISTSSTSVNGESVLIVRDQNGTVLLELENCGNSVSTSCTSGGDGNEGDFCDNIPDFLKPFFGCE